MNPSRFENFWETCPDRVVQAFRNTPREREIRQELSPRGSGKGRAQRQQELATRRQRQRQGARIFLSSGDASGDGHAPSYGKLWDRTYNPRPYPDACPSDWHMEHTFDGSLIGRLYQKTAEIPLDVFLARWSIVHTGGEARSKPRGKNG